MQRSSPFSRATSMMALIAAAMSLGPSMQQAALAQIGPYESRGKGKSKSAIGSGCPGAGMASIRAARKARNVRRHRAHCRG